MKFAPRTKEKSSTTREDETVQAEFLDDIRVSLKEMQDGEVLPAEDALELLELGLSDDELESRLSLGAIY